MAPEVQTSLIDAGSSLTGGLLGQLFNGLNMNRQIKKSKELMQYQWDNFNSPAAQLRSLNDVGLGVNAFVNGKGSSASPSVGMPTSNPVSFGDGVVDLGNVASYIQSVANAKKAGMDTKLSEQEIKNKEVQRQRDEFELSLRKQFGKDINSAELANSYMQLILASDQSDINEQQKAINEFKKLSEKAISSANESQASILRQNLENNPTVIKLENSLRQERIKSERAGQAASYASAEASHEQANVNRENRRIQAALADVEEQTKDDKILSLISEYEKNGWLNSSDAVEARNRLGRLHDTELRRDKSRLFKEVDSVLEWLKNKVSIFH